MSEEMIIKHCSPTLAGIKTGNMFNFSYSGADEMRKSLREWNTLLNKKGIYFLPLRFSDNKALIYAYRPAFLSRDLSDKEARQLLAERGYPVKTVGKCIARLINRIKQGGAFPHEVGLFLGYPPEDVRGFIENKAEGCKSVGCWKVYGDEKAAEKKFREFKQCTERYSSEWGNGKSVEKLTVSI